ncbi:thiazole synthase [Bartonella sp. TP]|uniref:thiazole synthase n=1 Tax=Bartonella sp. TP TaxID=3057550 RepID=UPI0025AF8307|nr:thiazole synthase [Bartonella sp. TP]MDN5249449.1 thiazole synthase [Alphaproteobacteria bacterium]WJW80156.1 thiazole synthase [Bartonella sp. TP]
MLKLYNKTFRSRFLLGTAQYPSLTVLQKAILEAEAEIITVSIRREMASGKQSGSFWQFLQDMQLTILPNTAGCYSVKEAVTTALCAREIFKTNWIKLELIANEDSLQPNVFELVEAAAILIKEGFQVFPYTTEDLVVAQKLRSMGCKVIMPWCAPIGSARGIENNYKLRSLRNYLPDTTLIIDAGLGRPSHATKAMELGYDAVLLNTAVAKAANPELMAKAFKLAVQAGRLGYQSGLLSPRDMAFPSTPNLGLANFE